MMSRDKKLIEFKKKEQELSKKNPGAGGSGKGSCTRSGMDKQDEQLLNQIQEEMRSMRNHFIVVKLVDPAKPRPSTEIVDPVPLMSNEFVDKRSSFLEKCQMYHWQFDEIRNAQHSTLMLLYYLHGKHKAAKAKMAAVAEKQGVQPAEAH